MKDTSDILVIGSGLGGLVSALLLAKEGYTVCVLEKNNQFGGNLQTFSRNKLIFDTGVHYLGGLSPGQNLYQFFSYLGIIQDLKLQQLDLDAYDKIIFGDDAIVYPHAQGYANFVEQLSKIFPEERLNLTLYCEKIQEICKKFSRYYLVGEATYTEDTLSLNLQDFLKQITPNAKLQAILAGSNFLYGGSKEHTPLYVHALTVNSYIQSAYRCINGGSQITKLLIKELRKYGAKVIKRAEVTQTAFTEEGKLQSVITSDGRIFTARKFIWNIEIRNVIQIVGTQHFKKAFVTRIQSLQPTTACFSVYIVLKPKTFPTMLNNYYYFDSANDVWEPSSACTSAFPFYMMSSTPNKDHPEYAESITLITYMDYKEVEAWSESQNTVAGAQYRGKDYEIFKQKKAEELINKASTKFLGLKESVGHVYTSSPLSYRDYIGSFEGNIYGYEKDCRHPMKTMLSPRTKIPNMYLTGQSVNMHGILGVTIGAFTTCAEILGKEILDERLTNFV